MLFFFLGAVNLLILFIYLIYHVYFFIYIYTFSQCLHPPDARGTASYQIMEFEFCNNDIIVYCQNVEVDCHTN